MKRMWEEQVEPRLRSLAGTPVHTLRMVVAGVPESTLDERTREARARHGQLDWTILANLTQVELLARGTNPGELAAARSDFETVLGADLVSVGDGNLEDALLDQLRARGETLAVAESMTGGLLAARLTAIPGASEAFRGGVVVYSAAAKAALLGLDPDWLEGVGTVSEPCAIALAEAARQRLGVTWALGLCGNAGPGAEGGAPVGAVHLALAGPSETVVRSFTIGGDRLDVQLRSAAAALDLLRRTMAASR
jgi:nicotinamide-nucleotide amidase